MCGIAGFINPNKDSASHASIIDRMLCAIAHRGPDGMGYLVSDHISMGTVRLAILDPQAGAQPISDTSGRYWLCYNGEIYNYIELRAELIASGCQFKTHCDTEVVLQAWLVWGEACLSRFNGCFSFALYDNNEQRLILARDRFGKRPLFYTQQGGSFSFASEMKAFKAIPGFRFEQDPEQLASIVWQWTPLPDQTGFKQIKSLAMGHWLSVHKGKVTHHKYHTLKFKQTLAVNSEQQAKDLIQEQLYNSVRLRLRSDVEVGVYLSGGVDSAIIAALAKEISSQPLSTFSIEFEDSEFNESPEQQMVARHLGTRHSPLRISYKDISSAFPKAIYHAEIPVFRSAFIPMYLLSQHTRKHNIKVVLSGEGADEAFLGYDIFKETQLRSNWEHLSETARQQQLEQLYPHLEHYGPENIAAITGLYQQFSQHTTDGLFSHQLRFQNGLFSTRLLAKKHTADPSAALYSTLKQCPEFSTMNAVEKAQWLEYKTLLPGYLLSSQGERMSLAHGIENRCPFIDQAVIDLASSVNLKFDDGFIEKRLLREAFKNRLPKKIIDQRKFPYRAPDVVAFSQARPDYLDMVCSPAELQKLPLLNHKFAALLTNKVLNKASTEISTKENQAFLFLLSMTQIHHQFVSTNTFSETSVKPPLENFIDLRSNTN